MMDLLDRLFSRFRWYRKWCGGHWEQWYVAVVDCTVWFQVDRCFNDGAVRPAPLCCGSPLECEDHPEWMIVDHEDWR